MGENYLKKAAGEAGEKTVDYETDHGQQQLEDVKIQAQVNNRLP